MLILGDLSMSSSSRFTGDDRHFLWSKGRKIIAIVDMKTFDVIREITLWVYSGRPIDPFFVIANRDCTRFMGVGDDSAVDSQPIAIFKSEEEEMSILASKVTGKLSFWVCAEVSFDQKYIYVGGCDHHMHAAISLLDFDEHLQCHTTLSLDMGDYKNISRIKRIEGTDVLLGGCYRNIVVIRKEQNSVKLTFIHSISCRMDEDIKSIAFSPKNIFCIGEQEGNMGIISSKHEISSKALSLIEYGMAEF